MNKYVNLQVGDRVIHNYKNFGKGTVVDILHERNTIMALVRFDVLEHGMHSGGGISEKKDCLWVNIKNHNFHVISSRNEKRL